MAIVISGLRVPLQLNDVNTQYMYALKDQQTTSCSIPKSTVQRQHIINLRC